jgi:hypothetical protein
MNDIPKVVFAKTLERPTNCSSTRANDAVSGARRPIR